MKKIAAQWLRYVCHVSLGFGIYEGGNGGHCPQQTKFLNVPLPLNERRVLLHPSIYYLHPDQVLSVKSMKKH